jgi:hypothetical protein
MFELISHIPYVCLTKKRPKDVGDGSGAREDCVDLSFMSNDVSVPKVILHHAHMTLVLKGIDRTRYRVLLLIRGSSKEDTVDAYVRKGLRDQVAPDPLTAGQRFTDMTPGEPRDYWLSVLGVRLRIVCHEWSSVCEFFQNAVKDFRLVKPLIRQLGKANGV